MGNGFSDGKNEANRLALGIKPRTTLKAVFGRVARNTPPGRFGARLPSAPAKAYKCLLSHFFFSAARRPGGGIYILDWYFFADYVTMIDCIVM